MFLHSIFCELSLNKKLFASFLLVLLIKEEQKPKPKQWCSVIRFVRDSTRRVTIDLDIKAVRKVALRELIWLTYFVTP